MKTFDLLDSDGKVFAFEIDNRQLGRRRVCEVIRAIPGAEVLREPRRRRLSSEDEFCEFELEGVRFVIWEPWGDSSRYWIGPRPPRWVPQIGLVLQVFQETAV